MANSEVKLKHKVQLRKKVEEPNATVDNAGEQTDYTPTPIPTPKKTKKWIWFLLGVIVIVIVCVIVYLLISRSKDNKTTVTQEQDIATLVSEESNDSLTATDKAENVDIRNNQGETVDEAANQEIKETEGPASRGDTPSSVSNMPSTNTGNTSISNDVEAEAMKVIRGYYGDGYVRKDRLGDKYPEIQGRVNELKRKGVF